MDCIYTVLQKRLERERLRDRPRLGRPRTDLLLRGAVRRAAESVRAMKPMAPKLSPRFRAASAAATRQPSSKSSRPTTRRQNAGDAYV